MGLSLGPGRSLVVRPRLRTALGLAGAVPAAALTISALGAIGASFGAEAAAPARPLDLIRFALLLAATLLVVLAVPVPAIGLVVHLVLRAQGQRLAASYVAAGAVTGCVCALLLALTAPGLAMASYLAPRLVFPAVPGGAAAALAFWLIRRPDRVGAGEVSALGEEEKRQTS